MPPSITATTSYTGGSILLEMTLSEGLNPNSTNVTLARYTGALNTTPALLLNNVPFNPIFLDVGDLTPNYLDFNTAYYYTFTDPNGSVTVGPIIPLVEMQIYDSYLDKTIFRLFKAGINSVAIPQGWRKINVLQAMPLTWGSEPIFPFIVMNLDLEQQEYTQIGENVDFYLNNTNIIPLIVYRRYSLNILSQDPHERDFYKEASKAVLYSMQQVLRKIGFGVSYDFQATNTQSQEEQLQPGFYECDIMLDITGSTNIVIQTNYGLIESIAPIVSASTAVSGTQIVFNI